MQARLLANSWYFKGALVQNRLGRRRKQHSSCSSRQARVLSRDSSFIATRRRVVNYPMEGVRVKARLPVLAAPTASCWTWLTCAAAAPHTAQCGNSHQAVSESTVVLSNATAHPLSHAPSVPARLAHAMAEADARANAHGRRTVRQTSRQTLERALKRARARTHLPARTRTHRQACSAARARMRAHSTGHDLALLIERQASACASAPVHAPPVQRYGSGGK
eukprot:5189822-Pleurochrysis_carterae.AAC.2